MTVLCKRVNTIVKKKNSHIRRDWCRKVDQQLNILSPFYLWHLNIYNTEHLVGFTNSKTLKFHSLMIQYALTLQPVLEPQPHQHSGSVCAGSPTPWPTTQYPAGAEYKKMRPWFSNDHYFQHDCRDASLLSTAYGWSF